MEYGDTTRERRESRRGSDYRQDGKPGTRGADYIERLHYAYTTKSGNRISDVIEVEEGLYGKYHKGDKIVVYRDRDDPGISVPKLMLEKNWTFKFLLFGAIAGLIDFLGLAVLVSSLAMSGK